DQIGSYYGLLEDLGNLSRELMTIEENDMNQQNLTFWKIMYRILLKKKKEYQELFTSLSEEITPTKISEQVLQILYNKEVNASVSSIENFYNCEYKYFLANSLNLQQIDTMTLDSKIQGNYFHKVFQILLANGFPVVEMFEQKMNEAIQSATIEFQRYFEYNQFNQYLKQQFDKILYSIGEILRQQSKVAIKIEATEFGFGRDNIPGLILELFQNKKLKIRGFIDRIDLINQTIGAVDYKSGKKTFDLSLALDGLQLQLLTYMDYLKSSYTNQTKQLWGAAYLSLLEPVVKLNDLSYFTQEAVLQKQSQQLLYNGIYIEETISSEIKSLYNGTAKNTFTNKEVEKLIENNRELFVNAGNELISGDIKINPAIDSKKVSIGCQYCRFKSICRYEPNIHCGRQIGNQKLND
ncbi:MAG: PD-(D/E)XK nuclease family protein, partial [Streptococcaceae bacterium]|nr:PD-(D/E)XK nuclease family protein [Streptococcaceae bacterium]